MPTSLVLLLLAQIRAVLVPAPPQPVESIPADIVLQSGHTRAVTAIRFTPDGKSLVSASEDGTVRFWDPRLGIQTARLEAHGAPVRSLTFTPDGRRLASGSDDGAVSLWDARTGALIRTLQGPAEPVTQLAFRPDGAWLASGGESVRLWDLADGHLLRTLAAGAELSAISFSPNGSRLRVAATFGDMEIRGIEKIYDVSTGALLETRNEIVRAASDNGRWQALQQGQWAAQRIHLRDGNAAVGTPFTAGQIGPIAFSPGGDWLAYAAHPHDVVGIRHTGGAPLLREVPAGDWRCELLAVSSDGALLAVSGRDLAIRVFDSATGALRHTLAPPQGSALAFTPDGRRILSGNLQLWEIASRRQLAGSPQTSGVIGIAVSPNGHYVAAGAQTLGLWELPAWRKLREFRGPFDVLVAPVFSPDGKLLAAASRGIVLVWDFRTGKELARFGDYDLFNPGALAFSPDSRLLAAAARDGAVRVYDLAAGHDARSFRLASGVSTLAFSPDGSLLAAGSRAPLHFRENIGMEIQPGRFAEVAVWNLTNGRQLFAKRAGDWVATIAWTSDGASLLAVSGNFGRPGSLQLLDPASGRELRTVLAQVDAPSSAAFSPDRRWFALSLNDISAAVKLWRLP